MLYIFLFAFLIFWSVIKNMLVNKLNIKKQKGIYKHLNKIHKWVEIILIIAIILMLFINAYYSLIGLTVLLGFRTFMEWKFEKESKTYILGIVDTIVVLLVLMYLK